MSISNINSQPKDVIIYQRDDTNSYWGEAHISGTNLIFYIDSQGYINADKSESFYSLFPPSTSISNTTLITGSLYPITASWADNVIGLPKIKSGTISSSLFFGIPLSASISFITPFSSDYSITLGSDDTRLFTFQSKSLNGFTINSNSNIMFTGSVNWQTIQYGEFN